MNSVSVHVVRTASQAASKVHACASTRASDALAAFVGSQANKAAVSFGACGNRRALAKRKAAIERVGSKKAMRLFERLPIIRPNLHGVRIQACADCHAEA
eukprot:6209563-Pleurochrysis_carterae.AAC.3